MPSASLMAQAFRCKLIGDTSISRAHSADRSDLALPDSFGKQGPSARIRALSAVNPSGEALSRFLNTGDQLNTLRQVQDSLRSATSGVQRCASLCDLIRTAYFPPLAHTVLRWGSIFNPGKTFSLYLAHLGKACQLLNIPMTW